MRFHPTLLVEMNICNFAFNVPVDYGILDKVLLAHQAGDESFEPETLAIAREHRDRFDAICRELKTVPRIYYQKAIRIGSRDIENFVNLSVLQSTEGEPDHKWTQLNVWELFSLARLLRARSFDETLRSKDLTGYIAAWNSRIQVSEDSFTIPVLAVNEGVPLRAIRMLSTNPSIMIQPYFTARSATISSSSQCNG